ncbi:chloride channel protein [Bariatricus sp. SGI.154]|uniref:ClC family H(+)/Cl(-) exchange transporter n=1 Tax=Bariatricus sp. SGI.154 TaxID=3420549 RepID=UPI003CFDBF56
MKKDTSSTIKRAERFQVILIGEGILVGGIGGLVIVLYRMSLEYAGQWLNMILEFCKQSPVRIAVWFVILLAMACLVGKLLKYEPMISGSGIPQLEGEMIGKLDQKWWRVLPAKFFGGFLCLLGGLALGREGPSIQLGAMVGKGVSKGLDRGKTEEKFLLTCGASAGLAAAFHAPLAGVMFSLEEVHKNFSVSVLLSVMTASLTADFMASTVMGVDSVFQFEIVQGLPQEYYWMILILGIVLGILGAFYNWFTLKVQSLYNHAKFLNTTTKLMIPFVCAGILGFTVPELLGSGHALIEYLTNEDVMLKTVIFILIGRFIFSAISFGSGAPGGIFFPLLVLGGFIGGTFATVGVQYFGLDAMYINNFVLLAMAGYFAAIVRAPLTGIILIFEMTGSLSHMLSLSIVSIVAYIVATLLRSKPIYESLLERILERQGEKVTADHGQKVLTNFVVQQGSRLDEALVSEIEWPNNCLLVAIQRGSDEIIPKGRTKLQIGDVIVTMTDERDVAVVHDRMEVLCRENL